MRIGLAAFVLALISFEHGVRADLAERFAPRPLQSA
jgi:hypothetical protein